jgi:hypothetical protein
MQINNDYGRYNIINHFETHVYYLVIGVFLFDEKIKKHRPSESVS